MVILSDFFVLFLSPLFYKYYLSVGFNTLSGNGGPATSAGFKSLYCVSFDLDGNLFVGSSAPYVRAIEKSDMIVNTIAGGSKKYSI